MQTAFDIINKKNHAVIIDCDLQDRPELIAQSFSRIKKNQTIHFVRKKRNDQFFQKFYTKIAYMILHYISGGKIISNSNYFKIIPPFVVKKIKKNTEIDPFWHYLFTKYSIKNKIIYYERKKRIYGSSKFNLFSLNPWLTFFTAANYFKTRLITITFGLIIINSLFLLLSVQYFYNLILIIISTITISLLVSVLFITTFISYYKKLNKRVYCKYK